MFFDGDADAVAHADAGAQPPEAMVTVARFESPFEAQMAKGMFESAGVECLLVGENVNNLLGAAFGVRLQVKSEDEAAARELMAQASDTTADSTAGEDAG